MDTPKEDGSTKRKHLRQVEKTKGETPKELLDEPEVPEAVKHIWQWWWELHHERGSTGMGSPAPITSEKLVAWSQLTGEALTPWEVRAIKSLDHTFMGWRGKQSKGKNENKTKNPQSQTKQG